MNADRQVVVVHIPQVLKNILGEEPRVGEDQRRAVGADLFVELRHRPGRRVSAPRNPFPIGQEDLDFRGRPRFACNQFDRIDIAPRGQPFAEPFRVGERRR